MRRKPKKRKIGEPKARLGLPDLDQSKAAVIGSLRSPESQRGCKKAWLELQKFLDAVQQMESCHAELSQNCNQLSGIIVGVIRFVIGQIRDSESVSIPGKVVHTRHPEGFEITYDGQRALALTTCFQVSRPAPPAIRPAAFLRVVPECRAAGCKDWGTGGPGT